MGFRIRHIWSGRNPSSATYNVALRKLIFLSLKFLSEKKKKMNTKALASNNSLSSHIAKRIESRDSYLFNNVHSSIVRNNPKVKTTPCPSTDELTKCSI